MASPPFGCPRNNNTIRYLLRAANRRDVKCDQSGIGRIVVDVPDFFENLAESQYWLAVLTTACGRSQQAALDDASRQLNEWVTSEPLDFFRVTETGAQPERLLQLLKLYNVILTCARQDVDD
jgi:hypothetical protein